MIKEGNTRITVTFNSKQIEFLELFMSICKIKTYGKAIRMLIDCNIQDFVELGNQIFESIK